MTAEQLSRLRGIIETDIRELHAALARWRDCNGMDENGRQRIEEPAQRAFHLEWKHSADRRMQELLRLLGRLEEEDFGVCVDCGEDIALSRLELLPATPCCARCMERREAGRGPL